VSKLSLGTNLVKPPLLVACAPSLDLQKIVVAHPSLAYDEVMVPHDGLTLCQ